MLSKIFNVMLAKSRWLGNAQVWPTAKCVLSAWLCGVVCCACRPEPVAPLAEAHGLPRLENFVSMERPRPRREDESQADYDIENALPRVVVDAKGTIVHRKFGVVRNSPPGEAIEDRTREFATYVFNSFQPNAIDSFQRVRLAIIADVAGPFEASLALLEALADCCQLKRCVFMGRPPDNSEMVGLELELGSRDEFAIRLAIVMTQTDGGELEFLVGGKKIDRPGAVREIADWLGNAERNIGGALELAVGEGVAAGPVLEFMSAVAVQGRLRLTVP